MELQVLEQNVIVSAFNNANGIQAIVDQIKAQVSSIVPDVTTAKGRKEIASLAYKVAQSKSAIDAEGKKLKEQYTVVTNKIDADRKFARDELDAERDRIRQPLTDWENAEKDRVAKHENAIKEITDFLLPENINVDAEILASNIRYLEKVPMGTMFEEFEEKIKIAKFETLEKLRNAIVAREKYEAEQAELERLRQADIERQQKERDEKIAREAADKARVEAEAKALADRKRAEQEKLEAEQREARLKLEKEQAELREKEAKLLAKAVAEQAEIDRHNAVEAERKRIEKDAQIKAEAERKEQQAREANKAHKKKICNEALQGLVNLGVSEELGKQILQAIHKGEVPHVSIKF
ncbi:hypothetical protein ACG95P_09605 [Acinetobacter guillouiae]|uniref:hypothetical protein n=1 Tax=Acinetobacter guillouiae TaxID=106649 RepID=UPI003AF4E419